MALDALWALLNPAVSRVSEVQAPIHASLCDTPAVLAEVSRVSSNDCEGQVAAMIEGADTPDTPPKSVRYQAKSAWALGCTLDTSDTPKKTNTEANSATDLLLGELLTAAPVEPKRLFRQRRPWLTDSEQSAAQAYHAHHFKCYTCIAAGRGIRYGRRCAVGRALWHDYTGAGDLQTQGNPHGYTQIS